jgi:hypothetical protein
MHTHTRYGVTVTEHTYQSAPDALVALMIATYLKVATFTGRMPS